MLWIAFQRMTWVYVHMLHRVCSSSHEYCCKHEFSYSALNPTRTLIPCSGSLISPPPPSLRYPAALLRCSCFFSPLGFFPPVDFYRLELNQQQRYEGLKPSSETQWIYLSFSFHPSFLLLNILLFHVKHLSFEKQQTLRNELIYLSVYLSVCLSIRPSTYPSIYLSVCLSIRPSTYPSIYLSFCLWDFWISNLNFALLHSNLNCNYAFCFSINRSINHSINL